MKHRLVRLIALMCLVAASSVMALAQNTSPLKGTIVDVNGALVAGAVVKAKSQSTAQEFTATSDDQGGFTIPALDNGLYDVTVTASGFKTSEVKDVKITVGVVTAINIALQVGGASEVINVTSTGEILQTQSANIGNTINGRQITELPFVSRNVLDLITNLPGTNTPGTTRTASVNGLPKGTLNITYDGINVQDNLLKSSDGFFTIIQPRVDAVDEVTLSTATPGADSNAEGATQIKFVTKSGTNEYHGGVYWYQKNTALDANTYFGNLNSVAKQPILLNEGGFKVGGPILKDKVFFFVNYERYLFPSSQTRSANMLDPSAYNGNFTYVDTTGATKVVNVLSVAANTNAANAAFNAANPTCSATLTCRPTNFPTALDPAIQNLLSKANAAAHSSGTISGTSNPLINSLNFVNVLGAKRIFFDQRFDINPTSKLHFENVYHYDKFTGLHALNFDNLNSRDPVLPGILAGTGSQNSDRYADSIAARYTINGSMVDEFRFGVQGSRVRFFPEVPNTVPDFVSLDGAPFRVTTPLQTTPSRDPSNQARNTPTMQLSDTFSWTRGQHSMNIGMSFSNFASYLQFNNNFIPTVALGLDGNDAAQAMFSTANAPTNFPNSSSTNRSQAASLYALLIANLTQVSSAAALQADGSYSLTKQENENAHQREFGFFGQDSFRFRPNLTLNYGLRYELQLPYYNPQGTFNRVLGGQTGLLGGGPDQITPVTPNTPAFKTDKKDFAPSFGFAWSPAFHFGDKGGAGILKKLVGDSGQTVLRGGYAIAYDREGVNNFYSIWGSNIGPTQSATINTTNGTVHIAPGNGANALGGIGQLYGNGATVPSLTTPGALAYPHTVNPLTEAMNDFAPNLRVGYVQSWSFGIQRELNRDTALEIRYVANHGTRLWRQYDLNELNTTTNGFVQEFINAQANLAANIAQGKGTTFSPATGATGLVALPAFTASFGGTGSANFANNTFITFLQQGQMGNAANTLARTASFVNNRIASGVAGISSVNYWMQNGGSFGGAFLTTNGGDSNYNSMQVELRRRLSKGFLFQGSYVWMHALSNGFTSSSVSFYQPRTFQNPALDKGPSPWNIQNTLKANFIYELPFGSGKRWSFGAGDVSAKIGNKLIEGWQLDGIVRVQSGTENLITSGRFTVNARDSGVVLNGITPAQLQSMIGVYPSTIPCAAASATCFPNPTVPGTFMTGVVYIMPPNLAINSACAFQQCPSGATFNPGAPYIGPPTTPGQFGQFLYLRGPMFWNTDLSIIKKTKITERVSMEMRLEATNAFNHTNFLIGGVTNDASSAGVGSASFGQTTNFFNDLSGTNDIGSRMIRWVLRVNF